MDADDIVIDDKLMKVLYVCMRFPNLFPLLRFPSRSISVSDSSLLTRAHHMLLRVTFFVIKKNRFYLYPELNLLIKYSEIELDIEL